MAERRNYQGRDENVSYQELLSPALRNVRLQAGQHVDVRLTAPNGYTAMRSYSIASAQSDSKMIELAIERLADGEVPPFLHDVGQAAYTIELRGPLGGHFL